MPRYLGREPTKSFLLLILLLPTFLLAQKPTIAMVDFTARGISEIEAEILTDRLRDELFKIGKYRVVERGMIESILSEQDFQLSGCTSDECLIEVGRLLGAQKIVGGSISKVGNIFIVSARLINLETGEIEKIASYDHRGEFEDMLSEGMGKVASMLSTTDNEIVESVSEGPLSNIVPQSIGRPPAPKTIPSARLSKTRPTKWPRFQLLYGEPLNFDSGFLVGVTVIPRQDLSTGKFSALPTLTIGQWIENYVHPDGADLYDLVVYIAPSIQARIQGSRIGVAGSIGIGYEFSRIIENSTDVIGESSGLNMVIASEVTYSIGGINLLLGMGVYSGDSIKAVNSLYGISF